MAEENRIQIHPSLTRPILMAGAERELTILIGFTSAIIWIAGCSLVSLVIAGLVFTVGMYLARAAAKEDPYLIKMFLRYVKYKDYYPATEKLETPSAASRAFRG